jgi:hypothetical protein
MARVVHVRVHGIEASDREALHARLDELSARREWRADKPWLADAGSRGLFEMEYFRHAAESEDTEAPDSPPLCAAGFLRIGRDETDALALLFSLRDLSERFHAHIVVRDPDNPIAKMRRLELLGGLLPDGHQLESVLVVRPIFKKLPGAVIEMYPPRALGFAFGTLDGADQERRAWSFLVHGMRGTAPDFLEAEAEAMRIYRGLRFLS